MSISQKEINPYKRGYGSCIAECAIMKDSDMDGITFGFRSKEKAAPNLGLLLARVQMGDSVGRADQTDVIPNESIRSTGVPVRVTEMFYSVARNAKFTKPRIYRFMQQMSFATRALQLPHGSVVTGK